LAKPALVKSNGPSPSRERSMAATPEPIIIAPMANTTPRHT
jgi:hypothetical protein